MGVRPALDSLELHHSTTLSFYLKIHSPCRLLEPCLAASQPGAPIPGTPTWRHTFLARDCSRRHANKLSRFIYHHNVVVGWEGFEPSKVLHRRIKSPVPLTAWLPTQFGWCGGDRTRDLRLKRPLLYQLSYTPSNVLYLRFFAQHIWWVQRASNPRPSG